MLKNRIPRVAAWLCLWLPPLGVLFKDIWLQAFAAGSNPYVPQLWAGVCRVAPYLPLHVAVFALLFAPMWLLRRGRYAYSAVTGTVLSVLAGIDVVYLRCYNVLPSVLMLPLLGTQTGKQTVANILPTLFTWWDVLLVADLLVWMVLFALCVRRGWLQPLPPRRPRTVAVTAGVCAVVLVLVPLLHACGTAKGLFRRLYVTADTVAGAQYFSFAGFHVADIVQTASGAATHAQPTKTDEQQLADYRAFQAADTGVGPLAGAFAGQNLLVIQVESLESFVLGGTINGVEVTPTLNRLCAGGYVFPNLYEQVKSGNSSDADFLLMTSLLPPNKSFVFGSYTHNTYRALPRILRDNGGYASYYFHGATNAIWDYKTMLSGAFGFDRVDMDYVQDEQLNGYLSDESFFAQTLEKLQAQPLSKPFYAHLVTCTSHIPCDVPADFDGLLLGDELAANPLGDYLQAIHYTDRQIGTFLEQATALGLLDNTVVAVVGDHGGVHKYYPHWVSNLSDAAREDWFLTDDEDYTLPLIVYHPFIESPAVYQTVGGQMDVLPTLLGLLGVEDAAARRVMFGRDLLATTRSFALRDDGYVYGTLTETERRTAYSAYYLSDLLIRSNRVSGNETEG